MVEYIFLDSSPTIRILAVVATIWILLQILRAVVEFWSYRTMKISLVNNYERMREIMRGRKDKIEEAHHAAIVKRYKAGVSLRTLAGLYGVAPNTIRRLLIKLGVYARMGE